MHSIISNRDINLSARRLLLLSVIRPSIEYGSEVWESNKGQTNALESVVLGGAKNILGCSSKTCNEAVRGDMGLETLQSRRDKAKLKWWYNLATIPQDRYPKQLLTLGAHAQRGLQYLVCVSVCLFVCLSTTILALQATRRLMSDTNSFSATRA